MCTTEETEKYTYLERRKLDMYTKHTDLKNEINTETPQFNILEW